MTGSGSVIPTFEEATTELTRQQMSSVPVLSTLQNTFVGSQPPSSLSLLISRSLDFIEFSDG